MISAPTLAFLGANLMPQIDMNPTGPSCIPEPQEIRHARGPGFEFSRSTTIYDATERKAGKRLSELFERACGYQLTFTSDRSQVGKSGVVGFVPAMPGDGLPAEGYALFIKSNSIIVKFADEAGAFYAVQTLRQLLPKEIESEKPVRGVGWTVPALAIRDWPRFSWRGMHLDVSRHFFPPEFIKRYIDFLAMHKMNRFHWHLTDDGGWRMEVEKYPKLTSVGAWRVDTGGEWPGGNWNYSELRFPGPTVGRKLYGGFYSKEQIRDIVRYAADRFVTVVPEIEMPGHSLPALVAYPEWGCEGVEPFPEPGFNRTNNFCPGKDATLRALEAILDESMELFPSPWIHIGADEVWKGFWQKCGRCQERIRSEGLAGSGPASSEQTQGGTRTRHTPEENLQSWFVRHMESYIWRKGRRLIGWDEILEGGLAPGAAVMSWRGIQGGIAAAKAGHEAVMSPTSHCYFDYSYQTTSTKHVYGWEPVPAELSAAEAKFILGGQANVWTEWIPTEARVEYMIFPRMLATAEVLWLERERRNWESFSARLLPYYGRLDALRADYHMPLPELEQGAILFEESAEVSAKSPPGSPFRLRYTLDGSVPGANSPEYQKPIRVLDSCVVSIAYVNAQGKAGDVARVQCRKFVPISNVDGAVPGLKAEVFEGRWDRMPDFEKLKAVSSGIVSSVGSALAGRQENFGVRITGFLKISEEGVYTIKLGSDDGSMLKLAGATVIDNDGLHPTVERSASIRLKPGFYPLEIGFFQAGGAQSLTLSVDLGGKTLDSGSFLCVP